jgi:hypothetical protein
MKMMINGYYSKSWIFSPIFNKFDSNFESIYAFEYKNKDRQKYTLKEIGKELQLNDNDFKLLIMHMKSLNVNVINIYNDVIEFTDNSFLNSTSLDYYEGYLYYDSPLCTLEKKKHYSELKEVASKWFQFRRNRISFSNI